MSDRSEQDIHSHLDQVIKLAVDQTHEGIQIVDRNWKYVYVNAAAEKHGHVEKEKLIGHTMMDAFPGLEKTEVFTVFADVMKLRKPTKVENYFQYPDGSKCWFELFIEPHSIGILIRSIDITDRKKLEEQYLHSQKLEAVGRLAEGVAHDFNNKIGIMSLYCELAESLLVEGGAPIDVPNVKKYLSHILSAVDEATILTKTLLAFSRKQNVELRVLNLNEVIEKSQPGLGRVLGVKTNIVNKFAKDLGNIKVDRTQIDQIMLNLMINARDAITDEGTITVETKNVHLDSHFRQTHAGVIPGDYVQLSVSDNGLGMTEATRAKIFEPFFTTKPAGKGTGLGLSVVQQIVHQYQGYIDCESEVGLGTKFHLYFPQVMERKEKLTNQDMNFRGNGQTILLVEDETLLREALAQTLTFSNYKVLSAKSASDGRKLFEEADSKVDILLADIILPGESGVELAQELQKSNSSIKVVFISGLVADPLSYREALGSDAILMQKPITTQTLLQTISEMLGMSSATKQI